ncbi:hypothetical protein [Bradyrhizobium yuanmingense]|uniref:hypothetical protein n=1 Tax=Bradyrhizobium yuanmingense TaxID=108015 RepID=UPI001CD6003A|nr:hypothetical protein [Bradyrhizobium yuanmingense]MCA1529673.1 hypothetical protein [Bradyrhizobium yuanmingense]
MIVAPELLKNGSPAYDDDDLPLSSLYIDINVLSVPPDVVLVNDACPELARILEHSRFPVIPARHRHRWIFICFTLDTVREDGTEDFFNYTGDKRNRLLPEAAPRKAIAWEA